MIDQVSEWASAHGFRVGALVGSVVVIAAGAAIVVAARRVTSRLLVIARPRVGFSYGAMVVITRTVTTVLWLAVALVLLNVWGVGVTGLWASFVSIATLIGVGFLATWTMVSNVTARFFLTIWRPFHLGDEVEVLPENLKGRVVDRTMMFTVLREEHGSLIQVPNNLFFQKLFRVRENADQYVFPFPSQGPEPARAAPRRSSG